MGVTSQDNSIFINGVFALIPSDYDKYYDIDVVDYGEKMANHSPYNAETP